MHRIVSALKMRLFRMFLLSDASYCEYPKNEVIQDVFTVRCVVL